MIIEMPKGKKMWVARELVYHSHMMDFMATTQELTLLVHKYVMLELE